MILEELRQSVGIHALLRGLSSPLFYLCAGFGFLGAFFPAPANPWRNAPWILGAPFLEEFTWRAILQNELGKLLPSNHFINSASIITSLAFAGAHILTSPSFMAALTFFPSLIFGGIWTKFHSTWCCGLLHLWYNLALRLF